MLEPLGTRIQFALAAMNAEAPPDTPELDALFQRLLADDADERRRATQRIWEIWCSHAEEAAARAMRSAVNAMEKGKLRDAGVILDTMVGRWPEWAEAWNKRATLRFLEKRDGKSLDDIACTLEREPRHFGALGGFGQICLRAGDESSALLAFERLLTIDPHLEDVRKAVATLRRKVRHTVH
ncbi:MAG: hypothetical protein F4X99_00495 [Gammaproteobacteria bacterium]|nr:hypothetical protein [Gammaproteobacteria bacterium]MYE80561.1 hypothetical protein [Gammaproteobacteria bacterium]